MSSTARLASGSTAETTATSAAGSPTERAAASADVAPAPQPGTPAASQFATPARTEAAAPAAAPQQASPTTATQAPLNAQLHRPLMNLAHAAPGEHVITLTVTPEHLGPVTVRAHVTADDIRIELFAPTEVGRDAVRGVLTDLRRDLAGSGLAAQLDLSARDQPQQQSGNDRSAPGQQRDAGAQR